MDQNGRLMSQEKKNYLSLLSAFSLLTLVSWPILFSFDLWVLKDRGSFLNLDILLSKHWRLGVDTFYSYGLLPVSLQHLLFVVFGRGYWPLIGCTTVTLILMAAFWTGLLRHLPANRIWLITVVLISPILLWVNPNLPYSLVQLSLLFGLLCVLNNRLDLAFASSVIGCFSVPSLPLAFALLIVCAIGIEWMLGPSRSVSLLVRKLLPGVVAYLLVAAMLVALHGLPSVLATATPLLGMRFYKAAHFDSLQTSVEFLYPTGHSIPYYIGYYIGTPVTWWFACTLTLFAFGLLALRRMSRRRALDPKSLFLVLCASLQAIFAVAARGSVEQYVIYDPILAAGVLVGITEFSSGRQRNRILICFLVLSMLSEVKQVRSTVLAWRDTRASSQTASLYAPQDLRREWAEIDRLSSDHKLLLLSYGTGANNYFPHIETADLWMLRTGQIFPDDRQRLLAKVANADVVVEDLTGLTSAWDSDAAVQRELSAMCLTASTPNFRTWWKRSAMSPDTRCLADTRHHRS